MVIWALLAAIILAAIIAATIILGMYQRVQRTASFENYKNIPHQLVVINMKSLLIKNKAINFSTLRLSSGVRKW